MEPVIVCRLMNHENVIKSDKSFAFVPNGFRFLHYSKKLHERPSSPSDGECVISLPPNIIYIGSHTHYAKHRHSVHFSIYLSATDSSDYVESTFKSIFIIPI